MLINQIKIAVIAATLAFVGAFAFAGESLDRVMNNGVLKVATDPNWPPQSFLNDANEMDGFDVDVAREIAKRLGVGLEFITPEWAVITAGRWSGRWDVSVGSMTPTKDRAKVLSFPAVYYYTPASIAVHEDSAVQTPAELSAKIIGATTSSTYEQYLQHDLVIDAIGVPSFTYQIMPGKILSLKDSATVLDDLRIGDGKRMDAMIGSLTQIQEAIKNGYPIRTVGKPVFYEPLAVAIDRGDDEFGDKLKSIIDAMHQDGTLSGFSNKWYGVDYTVAIE